MRITLHITTKDRHSEVALLLESLRKQTFQEWDLIVLDDASGTSLTQCHFLGALFSRLKLEGHYIKTLRNNTSQGVCHARNRLIEMDDFDNPLICRLDDDILLEPDYLQRLHDVIIKEGYDMASGIIPLLGSPGHERENEFLGKIINEHKLDEEGNLTQNNDECGYCYLDEGIYPTHQFRTNCMYIRRVQETIKYPINLTTVGFREEGFFSFAAILAGFTIGVDVQAKAYHLQTPSGGVRCNQYSENVGIDEGTFRKWIKKQFKKHGNFLKKYNELVSE